MGSNPTASRALQSAQENTESSVRPIGSEISCTGITLQGCVGVVGWVGGWGGVGVGGVGCVCGAVGGWWGGGWWVCVYCVVCRCVAVDGRLCGGVWVGVGIREERRGVSRVSLSDV